MLPVPVAKLRESYPKVNISLHEATPHEAAGMIIRRGGRDRNLI